MFLSCAWNFSRVISGRAVSPDRLLAGQKEQIAFQMKKALGTR